MHIDLPAEAEGRDRYENARYLLHHWLDEVVLRTDGEPAFYVYRMGYHDEAGARAADRGRDRRARAQ